MKPQSVCFHMLPHLLLPGLKWLWLGHLLRPLVLFSYGSLGFKSVNLGLRPTPLGRFLTAEQRKSLKKNPKAPVSIVNLFFSGKENAILGLVVKAQPKLELRPIKATCGPQPSTSTSTSTSPAGKVCCRLARGLKF